jgi:hypothetical protein
MSNYLARSLIILLANFGITGTTSQNLNSFL